MVDTSRFGQLISVGEVCNAGVIEANARSYPSSARRMAGPKTSARLNFLPPNVSTMSTQAAAAPSTFDIKETPQWHHPAAKTKKSYEPGTVTELRSVVGIPSVIPRERRYSMLSFSGARPEPFRALTVLVLAS